METCDTSQQANSRNLLIHFLDYIRAYEHESHELVGHDKRESSEFVDIYLKDTKSGTKGAEGDDPNDRRCATCKYEDDFYSSYCDKCDKNYCMWETNKPLTDDRIPHCGTCKHESDDDSWHCKKCDDGFCMWEANEELIDGISEQKIEDLAHEASMEVISRDSWMKFAQVKHGARAGIKIALKSIHPPSEGERCPTCNQMKERYNCEDGTR